jgi:type IV secretory pathway VirB6-like protein
VSRAQSVSGLAGASRTERPSRAFTPLKWTSFFHSCVYASLLLCAFAAGKPQPETLVLGWTHGILWIGMSLACIAATRARIVPLRLAVAVAVLGGIGPFFGSWEFVRTQRAYAADARKRPTRGEAHC